MSAWIVSKRHIDALVTLPTRGEKGRPQRNRSIAVEGQNFRSVNARYGEQRQGTLVFVRAAPGYAHRGTQGSTLLQLSDVRDRITGVDDESFCCDPSHHRAG